MNLNVSDWKPFKIQRTESQSGLFEIENCKCGSAGELDDGSDINYIGAKKSDNGVMRSVSLDGNTNLVSKGHGIMFICDGEGSVGYTNYMDSDFIGSTTTSIGYDDALTETNAMFLVSVLDNEKFKYSYGRKYRKNLITAEIYLPIQHNADGSIFTDDTFKYSDKGYVPDWQFMEDYIKSLHHKPLTTKNKKGKAPDLNLKTWHSFSVGRLFTMLNGKGITQEEIAENAGEFIAVQSGEDNNGVMGKIDLNYCKKMKYTYSEKPCLTVARSGSAGFVSYQNSGCVVGDSAKILLLPDEVASIEHYLFLQTMLTANRFKYTYGRKVTEDKYLNDVIDLPIQHNADGSTFTDSACKYSDEGFVPDWEFMENYIKSLPYGDRLEG